MLTVLLRLPGGGGVVRLQDGTTVVTNDVGHGRGTCVRDDDPFQPVKSSMDGDRSVVGGLLPRGAVSVEVVDGRGMRFMASVTIDPIADPAARLLGPQPPDPDAR